MKRLIVFVCALFAFGVAQAESDMAICPENYYIDGDLCKPCNTGFSSPGGNVTECTPLCPAGQWHADGIYPWQLKGCQQCPSEYPNSEPGAISSSQCYSNTIFREWDGTVQCRNIPDGYVSAICTVCESEPEPCEYTEYYMGTIRSGCTANPCLSDIIESATPAPEPDTSVCPAGTYDVNGDATECKQCPVGTYSVTTGATECKQCPDEFPNTDGPGATSSRACHSDVKERPWTGRQICIVSGCVNAVCLPCEIKPCKYVEAYHLKNEWGPSGVISGCETNDANCIAPAYAVDVLPGFGLVDKLRCEQCAAGTYGPGGINATCTQCPENIHVSPAGATVAKDCGRILNYQKPGDDTPTQIFLNGIRNTSPSFNVQIGNDVLYANMTPVNDTTMPGMYAEYDDQKYIITSSDAMPKSPHGTFVITTTNDTKTYAFKLSAIGTFAVDWGDGTVENITRDDTTQSTYQHTYNTANTYYIGFYGVATGYSTDTSAVMFYGPGKYAWSPHTGKQTQKISGSLGSIFPTLGDGGAGNQPLFTDTFKDSINLTGEIPAELFDGISGTPAAQMFVNTFSGCTGLTGQSATVAGVPLYEWAAEISGACPDTGCATYSGVTGLSDYDEIPDMFK